MAVAREGGEPCMADPRRTDSRAKKQPDTAAPKPGGMTEGCTQGHTYTGLGARWTTIARDEGASTRMDASAPSLGSFTLYS